MNSFDSLCNILLNSAVISEAFSDVGDREAEAKGDKTEAAFANFLATNMGEGNYNPNPRPGELEEGYQNFMAGAVDWCQATREQETKEHFDFIYRDNTNKEIRVEVKGNKDKIVGNALAKLFRKRVDPSKGIFVELQGVTGHPGWLYGNADLVAFQNADGRSFTAWPLATIRNVVDQLNLGNAPIVGDIEDALHHRYQRPSKRDFITIVSADAVQKAGGNKTILR